MLICIDHVTFAVPDLERGRAQLAALGFAVGPVETHPGRGTHGARVTLAHDTLELIAIRDAAEHRAAVRPGDADDGLDAFIAAGGGFRHIAIASDDLDADLAAMRARGVSANDARPACGHARIATLGPQNPLPLVFVPHRTGHADAAQPNGAIELERAYLVTDDLKARVAACARVLGLPAPDMKNGVVIKADIAVFQIGPTGLGIAQPYGPGAAADALAHRANAPFQALYQTRGLDAVTRCMQAHGLPAPARTRRNAGDEAMLATPGIACGAWVAFVGPVRGGAAD